ncbi:cyclic nucleotide-binding domain-containing protein [Anaerolineales bacterium HSG6]|nr:cyclic nucleotide-binding domain-containing protein [Anaerolineales bacterium HSG6]MDM8530814.1 cyclic nucleotide-binding domain-containing protein [Anaerolineales bacterium HSG25]
MKMIKELIHDYAFFRGLTPEYQELLAGCGSNVRFNPNEFIFREGQPADKFYLIRHGKVSIDVYMPQRGIVTIETIGEGEVLGWSWLFEPYQWHSDARALVLTRAVAFDGQCLRDKCDADVAFGYDIVKRFAQIIIHRLQATQLQNLDVYSLQKRGP